MYQNVCLKFLGCHHFRQTNMDAGWCMRDSCQKGRQRASFATPAMLCWKASSQMFLWLQVCQSDLLKV